jgi:EAL and modified HD-GYP domain-containing signal transduction protein
MAENSYLIGRQPILDRLERVCYYELLFRSSGSPGHAAVKNATYATSRVAFNALSCFNIEEILAGQRGFINVDAQMLMSDTIELLPAKSLGLELLESVTITPEVVSRCRELKALGYVLALDDHEYSRDYEELYRGVVDIVKIDLITTPLAEQYQIAEYFSSFPVRLLAEKVDTRHVYLRSRSMGFELFQGYFFARPSTLQKRRLEGAVQAFLKLMQLLSEDAELDEIELAVKQSPALTYKLLLLVNSVAVGRREKIRTVRHAITLVGIQHLKRWVQLAIFANEDSQDLDNPLMEMAAVRAAFLERLAHLHPGTRGLPHAEEEAFMVGTLSLLVDTFGFSCEELVTSLNLSDEIRNALLQRAGGLGELLTIAEMIEALELDRAAERLEKAGVLLDDVLECQKKAYSWRRGLV